MNYRNSGLNRLFRKRKLIGTMMVGVIGAVVIACGSNATPAAPMQPLPAAPAPTVAPLNVQPAAPAIPAPVPESEEPEMAKTIVDVAVEDGRFTTLVAALQAAELDGALMSEGPYTVFAPTDDAFNKLPEGTVETLLGDIPALTNILLYHVVSGNVRAADVKGLDSAETLQGQSFSITVMDGKVMVDDAEVIITDIEAANGTIHVIDAVIVPEETA